MKRDEQSQCEPAVKQRRALDGVDNEKKIKKSAGKRATTAGKSGPTTGKDKKTDQEN